MTLQLRVPDRGDPSDVLQIFPNYNLQLHCCRYWWLKHWEFKELSFPYWRIYHNSNQGAFILYKDKEYALTPDKIIMITPNTSYATRLHNYEIPDNGYLLKGGRMNGSLSEQQLLSDNCILHLFIHFNIVMPYDNISHGIFIYDLNNNLKEKLKIIKQHLNYEYTKFSFYSTLAIHALISDLLSGLPKESWNLTTKNYRILKILNYIENNTAHKLANTELAGQAKMATNSFTRLFKEEIGMAPQKYVTKKRIDKACILLHHSDHTIDEIAFKTGYADRYHFSRIFKQITGLSPVKYRKEFEMNND